METKDWILLGVPILANGIIVFIFQKFITIKLERLTKKSNIRDEIIILIWKKLQYLNEVMIHANIVIRSNPDMLAIELEKIKEAVIDIIQYYDTNRYDLDIISGKYNDWEASWNKFTSTLKEFSSSELTNEKQQRLGSELQSVKENTLNLIQATRSKY